MKIVIVDTNFIFSCLRQKIDFSNDLTLEGFTILIPTQVLMEIKKISRSKKIIDSDFAKLVLKLIKEDKLSVKDIGTGYADHAIISYAKKNPLVFLATLDKEISRSVRNAKIIIRNKKRLEVLY